MQAEAWRDPDTERIVKLTLESKTAGDELMLSELFRIMNPGKDGKIMISNARDVDGKWMIWEENTYTEVDVEEEE